jgi:MYXO-CTERM domain-containing protein
MRVRIYAMVTDPEGDRSWTFEPVDVFPDDTLEQAARSCSSAPTAPGAGWLALLGAGVALGARRRRG